MRWWSVPGLRQHRHAGAGPVRCPGGARQEGGFPARQRMGDRWGPRGAGSGGSRLRVPDAGQGSDLLAVGPSGQRSRLPAFTGRTYPGHGIIVPRLALDHALREAALEAGAVPVRARITAVEAGGDGRVDAVISSDGQRLAGEVIIAADGALSPVARLAGMLDPQTALWGFAIRAYVPADVPLPLLVLLDASPWRIYPGYGWLFPGEDGQANVGVGVGLGSSRGQASLRGDLARLVALLGQRGDLSGDARPGPVIGGWLRMGGTGTPPAAGNVLLAGRRRGIDKPPAGRGHGPGHGQRQAGRRGGARRPGPGGPRIYRGNRGGVRAVHGRRSRGAERAAAQGRGPRRRPCACSPPRSCGALSRVPGRSTGTAWWTEPARPPPPGPRTPCKRWPAALPATTWPVSPSRVRRHRQMRAAHAIADACFPRKRLVKSCTNRFRGNVMDVG